MSSALPKKLKLKLAQTGECRRSPPPLNYTSLVKLAVQHWGKHPFVFQVKDEVGDHITVDSLSEYIDALTMARDMGEPILTLNCYQNREELISALKAVSVQPHPFDQEDTGELRFDGDEAFTKQEFFEEYGNYDRWYLAKTLRSSFHGALPKPDSTNLHFNNKSPPPLADEKTNHCNELSSSSESKISGFETYSNDEVFRAAAAAASAVEKDLTDLKTLDGTLDGTLPGSSMSTPSKPTVREVDELKQEQVKDKEGKHEATIEPKKAPCYHFTHQFMDKREINDKDIKEVEEGVNSFSHSKFTSAMDMFMEDMAQHRKSTNRTTVSADGYCCGRNKRNRRCRVQGRSPKSVHAPFYCNAHKLQDPAYALHSPQEAKKVSDLKQVEEDVGGEMIMTMDRTLESESDEEQFAKATGRANADISAEGANVESKDAGTKVKSAHVEVEEPASHEDFHESLHIAERTELAAMGFNDEDMNIALLTTYEGRVDKVVDHYLS